MNRIMAEDGFDRMMADGVTWPEAFMVVGLAICAVALVWAILRMF